MVLSQQDLLRLLESLRSADGLELVRRVAERMPQELIEAEATARIGAEWNGHTDTRTALRNGQRDKTLTIQAGDLDLAILKLRSGSFFPALLQRRRRIDQALHAVIMEAYVHGVSTRSVGDLAKALGADTRVSKSEISRICQDLDGQLTVFRNAAPGSHPAPVHVSGRDLLQGQDRAPDRLPGRGDRDRDHRGRRPRGAGGDGR